MLRKTLRTPSVHLVRITIAFADNLELVVNDLEKTCRDFMNALRTKKCSECHHVSTPENDDINTVEVDECHLQKIIFLSGTFLYIFDFSE